MLIAVICWVSMAFWLETLPVPNEGAESAATDRVKLIEARSLLLVSESESRAVQVIVVSPEVVGVPEMVLVEAVQLSPAGSELVRSG